MICLILYNILNAPFPHPIKQKIFLSTHISEALSINSIQSPWMTVIDSYEHI